MSVDRRLLGRDLRPAAAAAAALILLVVGVPVALMLLVGSPIPHSVPGWGQLRTTFDRPSIPASTVWRVVGGAAWLGYAALVGCLAAESVAIARSRMAESVTAFEPLQRFVTRLLDPLVDLWRIRGALGQPDPDPLPLATIVQALLRDDHRLPVLPETESDPEQDGEAGASVSVGRYVVARPRDTLWAIASRLLGDGRRWKELAVLNRETLREAAPEADMWLPVGIVLTLPGADHGERPTHGAAR